jgi:hypothetical protein
VPVHIRVRDTDDTIYCNHDMVEKHGIDRKIVMFIVPTALLVIMALSLVTIVFLVGREVSKGFQRPRR